MLVQPAFAPPRVSPVRLGCYRASPVVGRQCAQSRGYTRQLLHDWSAQVRAELADLGVFVADYELLLIVSLEPRGVVL